MADDPANAQSSNQGGNDAADERQNEPRTGIPGKGFDAAQSDAPNPALDTDGRGSANDASVVDPNVEAVTGAFEGRGASGDAPNSTLDDSMPASGISRDGPDAVDLEDFSGGSRREPGR